MVDYNGDFHVGHKSLQFFCESGNEGSIVVYGYVGYDIDGDSVFLFEIVETMNLHNFLMLCNGLHDGVLQPSLFVFSSGDSIHTDGYDDAMLVKYVFRYTPRQTVNVVGIRGVVDIHM